MSISLLAFVSNTPHGFCNMGKPILWIPNLEIVEKINACGFFSNENHIPTNGIKAIGIDFKTHLGIIGEETIQFVSIATHKFVHMG